MSRKIRIEILKRAGAAVHPGAVLREEVLPVLKAAGVAKVAVAQALGVSRRTLEDLVTERAGVSPQMALRLAKYLGGTPEIWLRMQMAWDLARAAEAMAPELAAIEPYSAT